MLVVNERLGEEGGELRAESGERRAESGERRAESGESCLLLVARCWLGTVNLEL
jgi:hypothetical protein